MARGHIGARLIALAATPFALMCCAALPRRRSYANPRAVIDPDHIGVRHPANAVLRRHKCRASESCVWRRRQWQRWQPLEATRRARIVHFPALPVSPAGKSATTWSRDAATSGSGNANGSGRRCRPIDQRRRQPFDRPLPLSHAPPGADAVGCLSTRRFRRSDAGGSHGAAPPSSPAPGDGQAYQRAKYGGTWHHSQSRREAHPEARRGSKAPKVPRRRSRSPNLSEQQKAMAAENLMAARLRRSLG